MKLTRTNRLHQKQNIQSPAPTITRLPWQSEPPPPMWRLNPNGDQDRAPSYQNRVTRRTARGCVYVEHRCRSLARTARAHPSTDAAGRAAQRTVKCGAARARSAPLAVVDPLAGASLATCALLAARCRFRSRLAVWSLKSLKPDFASLRPKAKAL